MSPPIYAQAGRAFNIHAGDVVHVEQDTDGRWHVMHVMTAADLIAENHKLRMQLAKELAKPATADVPNNAMPIPPSFNTAQALGEPLFKFGSDYLRREEFLQRAGDVLMLPYANLLVLFCLSRPDQFFTLRSLRAQAGPRIVTDGAKQRSQCNYAWNRLYKTGLLQCDPLWAPNKNKHHEQLRLGVTKEYADTTMNMILDYMTARNAK